MIEAAKPNREMVVLLEVPVEVEDKVQLNPEEFPLAPVFHSECIGHPVYQYQLYSLNSSECDSPSYHLPTSLKPCQHACHQPQLQTMRTKMNDHAHH
jgi:hypothetical protein